MGNLLYSIFALFEECWDPITYLEMNSIEFNGICFSVDRHIFEPEVSYEYLPKDHAVLGLPTDYILYHNFMPETFDRMIFFIPNNLHY